jgi:hypothetical protein
VAAADHAAAEEEGAGDDPANPGRGAPGGRGGREPTGDAEGVPDPRRGGAELVAAAEKFDVEALKQILGPDGVDLVVTEDQVMSKNQAAEFAAIAREKTKIVVDPEEREDGDDRFSATRTGRRRSRSSEEDGWVFDTKSGRKEILYRPRGPERARRDPGLPRLRRSARRVRD